MTSRPPASWHWPGPTTARRAAAARPWPQPGRPVPEVKACANPGATRVRPGRQGSNGRQGEACRADQQSPGSECWTASRRLLGPLEWMQRDAIVQSLLDYHGSMVKTAGSPGMSRATIYRKIHQYGIITPAS
jgi:DNA-binding NtrC family response regulator